MSREGTGCTPPGCPSTPATRSLSSATFLHDTSQSSGDREVVTQLLAASNRAHAMGTTLTERESQVVGLIAEGRSNAIATRMFVSEGAVEKHVANIFAKLGMPVSDNDSRRVLAVLHYLGS